MAVTYYALLTTVGAGKLANATALGTTLKITQLAVGDGGGSVPTPDASRTALVNEVRRAPLNQLSVDPANAAQIIAEQVIPEDVGGWWIREMGLYDKAGALIAYANCAPSYKPQLAEGSGRTQTVRMVLIVSNTASVELKIDPSVVLATRQYVDDRVAAELGKLDYKQSARYATTGNINLSGLATQAGGDWPAALTAGDRVLVKHQATASQNGLYVAAAGAWARAVDADNNAEVTPGMVVVIESGTLLADTIWQLVTDAPIVVGTTALTFRDITDGLARLQSPAFTGNPTAPTSAQFANDASLATTAFVQNALGNLSGTTIISGSTTLTAAHMGRLVQVDSVSSTDITLPLSSACPDGTLIWIRNVGIGLVTIKKQGSDVIGYNAGTDSVLGLPVLGNGDVMVLESSGSGAWRCIEGSALLKYQAVFGASLSSSGYQKFPSGLIIQWGRGSIAGGGANSATVTFPLAFPNGAFAGLAASSNNLAPSMHMDGTPNSRSQMTVRSSANTGAGAVAFSYIVFGY